MKRPGAAIRLALTEPRSKVNSLGQWFSEPRPPTGLGTLKVGFLTSDRVDGPWLRPHCLFTSEIVHPLKGTQNMSFLLACFTSPLVYYRTPPHPPPLPCSETCTCGGCSVRNTPSQTADVLRPSHEYVMPGTTRDTPHVPMIPL